MAKPNNMNTSSAARIQKANALKHGGQTPKGSFPARAQKAAARNVQGGK